MYIHVFIYIYIHTYVCSDVSVHPSIYACIHPSSYLVCNISPTCPSAISEPHSLNTHAVRRTVDALSRFASLECHLMLCLSQPQMGLSFPKMSGPALMTRTESSFQPVRSGGVEMDGRAFVKCLKDSGKKDVTTFNRCGKEPFCRFTADR